VALAGALEGIATAHLPAMLGRVSSDRVNAWTVMSSGLIVSAVVARAMAWFAGSTTVAHLVLFLIVAGAAATTGRRAQRIASPDRLDRTLSMLCARAGFVQTVLGLATLFGALVMA